MSQGPARLLRVLVIQHGTQWLAQGLDYNLATQAPSQEAAVQGFLRILRAHLRKDAELGREPLAGIGPAPSRFFSVWHEMERRSTLPSPVLVDDQGQISAPLYLQAAVAQSANELNR